MTQALKPVFWMAGLFMALFTADVVAGAFFHAAFLTDVMEALVLAISCGFFVSGILLLEGRQKGGDSTTPNWEE